MRARILLAAVLGLAVILAWTATRTPAGGRPLGLDGGEAVVLQDGLQRGGSRRSDPEPSVEESPRVAAAPTGDEGEAEARPPRLLVETRSEGTSSPVRPLPGVAIHAEGLAAPLGTTDGTGRLEVELPLETEGVRLHAVAVGHARASTTAYVVDGVARAELTLAQVAVLVGRVRHADGTPAADARVAAFDAEEARAIQAPEGPQRQGPGTPDTLTDEQGRYALEVAAGAWRLASTATRGAGRSWGWTPVVEAVEGAEARLDDLVLPPVPASRVLRGRVVDWRRTPVAEARVGYDLDTTRKSISTGSLPVDAEGRFTITGEAGDVYELVAGTDAPGLAAARTRGVVGGAEVELVLERAPMLEVVVSTADGPPARELRWWLGRVDEAGDAEPIRYGVTPPEARGEFSVTWPEDAEVLQFRGYAGHLDERVSLPDRPATDGSARVEVHLRPGLRVEGRIVGAARGLARPLVRARPVGGGDLGDDPNAWPRRGTSATRMTEDGSFVLGFPEPGSYLIGVSGELRAPLVVGPFDVVEPPGIVDLELTLERPGPSLVGDE